MNEIYKRFFYDKIIPICVTAILSALISILGNILSAYTGDHAIKTDPKTVGAVGIALKSIYLTIK